MGLSFKLHPIEAEKASPLPVPAVVSYSTRDTAKTYFVQLSMEDKRGREATQYLVGSKTQSPIIDGNTGKFYFIFDGLKISQTGEFRLVANLYAAGASGSDYITSVSSKTIIVLSSAPHPAKPEICKCSFFSLLLHVPFSQITKIVLTVLAAGSVRSILESCGIRV